jgi:hypothetical protein
MQWLIKWVKWTSDLLWRCLWYSFGISSIPHVFFNFKEFINFCKSHGLTFSGGSFTTARSRAWTVASICRSWFSAHSLCGVNCFYKQQLRWLYLPAEILGLKDHEWQLVPLVHPCLRGASQWAILPEVLPLCLQVLFPTVQVPFFGSCVIAFETQFISILHPAPLVSCHISLPRRSLFISDKVILLVDSLYADVIEAVKARAALSASTPELISNLGDTRFEARLWNHSQSVHFSSGLSYCRRYYQNVFRYLQKEYHILQSQIRDSTSLEDHVSIFMPPGSWWSSYNSRHCIPVLSPPLALRVTVGVYGDLPIGYPFWTYFIFQ